MLELKYLFHSEDTTRERLSQKQFVGTEFVLLFTQGKITNKQEEAIFKNTIQP